MCGERERGKVLLHHIKSGAASQRQKELELSGQIKGEEDQNGDLKQILP